MDRAEAIGKLIASLLREGSDILDAAAQIDEVTADEDDAAVIARAQNL